MGHAIIHWHSPAVPIYPYTMLFQTHSNNLSPMQTETLQLW